MRLRKERLAKPIGKLKEKLFQKIPLMWNQHAIIPTWV